MFRALAGLGILFVWFVAVLASLGLPIVLIWAIVKLVLKYAR